MFDTVFHRINDPSVANCHTAVEFDVRSENGVLVVSHDRSSILPCTLAEYFASSSVKMLMIVNVKEANLEEEILEMSGIHNDSIVFLDSQIPDIVRLSKQPKYKGRFAIRVSNYEPYSHNLINLSGAKYIWVDYDFYRCLIEPGFIDGYTLLLSQIERFIQISSDITPIFVLPELYGIINPYLKTRVMNCINKLNIVTPMICKKMDN